MGRTFFKNVFAWWWPCYSLVGAINQAVAEGPYKLDIPAQPFGDALQQLAERADIQIIYSREVLLPTKRPRPL